jgi:asparagine synthase (glutamine-hydrolysing)
MLAGDAAAAVRSKVMETATLAAYGEVAAPQLVEADGLWLAIAGHPRLRRGGDRVADPLQCARALRERGAAALADFGGDFALAAWDSRRRRGLLAIDRIGMHQLSYMRSGDALVFATTLDLLGRFPGVQLQLRPQAVYDYLYYHVCPGPDTIYQHAQRVPAGQFIEFGAGAAREPRQHWAPRFSEGSQRDVAALKHEFFGLLEHSVREAAQGALSGSFLSGGTDSSTVSGMLARVGTGPARSFSIGFDAQGYDETSYARIAAKHYGLEHHVHYVTPAEVVDAVPSIAAAYDQPFGNASAIPAYYCARQAREHGVQRLLAGDGGDELFGGNERYATQHLLALYHRVPGWLRRGLVEPALTRVPGVEHVPMVRKLRSYVLQARTPMPQRYETYNLLLRLGAEQVLTPDFLHQVDQAHPRHLMADAHAPYANASLINQMLGIDLRFVLADTDLPKVVHMCNLAGVDVAFPLLDDRLVDFSMRLPSDLKLRGTQLRWFFKRALDDFLPREIITKPKHGFGLPVGVWLTGHPPLLDMAVAAIERLRPRGIVRREFVADLLSRRLREHAGYYGTMVWLLMMLGLWLDSHGQ